MARLEYYCTEPSHPPIFRIAGQKTLYKTMSEAISEHETAGVSFEDMRQLLLTEFADVFAKPSDHVEEGLRIQGMRRQIASEWGEVLYKLDNLSYLTGWAIIGCVREQEGSELHFVQGLLALEAIRNVFATVNQVRSALAQETLPYLRTLHEIYVKSRFLDRFSVVDPNLPGRFSYYNNSTYLDYYLRFGPSDALHDADNSWAKAEKFFASRHQKVGKGNYGWAYPHILSRKSKPNMQPTFRHLMDEVDGESAFYKSYYEVSSSKAHGEFIWGTSLAGAAGVGYVGLDSYSTGGIAIVLELMLPLFEDILKNTASSCSLPKQVLVMDVATATIKGVDDSVKGIEERSRRRFRPTVSDGG